MKRMGEDPTRMFAGEGDPARTNRRFKLLSANSDAKRLSTAFDSVTLYGYDPDRRPDIYGKVGNSGVSVCTLDDVKVLYGGFELCAPNTSVSMTINGPGAHHAGHVSQYGHRPAGGQISRGKGPSAPDADEYDRIKTMVLENVRGTVQADILKEDQGQNTCIFSIDFALKMMGDIQQYFIEKNVRNFYSVSISGYHIAEAGANPISQLAFTLANGFTYLEYYLSRGMPFDSFAPNLSFFFSNGMDPEYTSSAGWPAASGPWPCGRNTGHRCAARCSNTISRPPAAACTARTSSSTTSAPPCRPCAPFTTTAHSLHTNAFDEAITTPTEESVRRALAIQLIINREWGLAKNENPYQGSFIVDELTDLVEEAVLMEFDRSPPAAACWAPWRPATSAARSRKSPCITRCLKHTGDYPIVGVNTFRDPHADGADMIEGASCIDLARATTEEKESQLNRLKDFQHATRIRPPRPWPGSRRLALSGDNIFAELMETVKCCSLGQITGALYEVGGQYRRNM
jgi:methylmalonyl-CoA mutase